jgi:hypothetical protein
MCDAAISLVMGKAVLRIRLIKFDHHSITRDFGENRGRGNRDTKLITFNYGSLKGRFLDSRVHRKKFGWNHLIAVDEQTIGNRPQGS